MEEITVKKILGYTEESRKKKKRNIKMECDGMCQFCESHCEIQEIS